MLSTILKSMCNSFFKRILWVAVFMVILMKFEYDSCEILAAHFMVHRYKDRLPYLIGRDFWAINEQEEYQVWLWLAMVYLVLDILLACCLYDCAFLLHIAHVIDDAQGTLDPATLPTTLPTTSPTAIPIEGFGHEESGSSDLPVPKRRDSLGADDSDTSRNGLQVGPEADATSSQEADESRSSSLTPVRDQPLEAENTFAQEDDLPPPYGDAVAENTRQMIGDEVMQDAPVLSHFSELDMIERAECEAILKDRFKPYQMNYNITDLTFSETIPDDTTIQDEWEKLEEACLSPDVPEDIDLRPYGRTRWLEMDTLKIWIRYRLNKHEGNFPPNYVTMQGLSALSIKARARERRKKRSRETAIVLSTGDNQQAEEQ
ncbi:uncharacterized protein KY384_007996 [Bacidia gigantensis]|uniref:uncharacterized protein n=1 Tax=Bacidia gigantensis TaxID=2732470 RepID=UPI001D03FF6F|nr:uncharacterized protein KY384_007996 [Bacidia gigantensis]KAG8527252.1 hypothetical protein KY384_007996 [Bacidia gigantensis]